MPHTLMVQGTTSDAGKSILVTGLCRILQRRGIKVAPFKPQNMALNSAVTACGGEIGRAQALQAQAAGAECSVHMNPVLLKPNTDTAAQVIIQGKALTDMDARHFHDYKQTAHQAVMDSWGKLCDSYEAIVVEGAGSPAEINLREGDIANMGFAEAADCSVVLIADIDRGGVFAHLVGTLDLLSESEQARVIGFVINRFRGDISLLEPGLDWLEARTGKPVIGVLPYLENLRLDAEDAISETQTISQQTQNFRVIVPVLPRISNHTDFDALRQHPGVDLTYIGTGEAPPPADLIILPGSKHVRADLNWLLDNDWKQHLDHHLRYGGKILGICGGMQMLGTHIKDPVGVEGEAGTSKALAYVDIQTTLESNKKLYRTTAHLPWADCACEGYEIHCGQTIYSSDLESFCTLADGRRDGMISADGQIAGTYLHGVFDLPEASDAILHWAGLRNEQYSVDVNAIRESEITRLADSVEASLRLETLFPGMNWQ